MLPKISLRYYISKNIYVCYYSSKGVSYRAAPVQQYSVLFHNSLLQILQSLRSRREAKGERREVMITSLRVGLVINILYYQRAKLVKKNGLHKYL